MKGLYDSKCYVYDNHLPMHFMLLLQKIKHESLVDMFVMIPKRNEH
jgi:hypothetical protein